MSQLTCWKQCLTLLFLPSGETTRSLPEVVAQEMAGFAQGEAHIYGGTGTSKVVVAGVGKVPLSLGRSVKPWAPSSPISHAEAQEGRITFGSLCEPGTLHRAWPAAVLWREGRRLAVLEVAQLTCIQQLCTCLALLRKSAFNPHDHLC